MRPSFNLFKAVKPRNALDAQQLPPPTGPAFALVRRVLTDRPRHFRELLAEGVEVTLPEEAAESSSAASKKASLINTHPFRPKPVAKGANKNRANLEEITVPEGHPFVSGNYLKNRIIPTLAGLDLIKRVWMSPFPNTYLAKYSPDKKHVMWEINPTAPVERWEQVTSTDVPVNLRQVARIVGREKRAVADAEREAKFASGEEVRTEREIAAWAGRPKGITTRLERLHLNTRRARARPAKEARRAEFDAMRRAVVEAARAAPIEG